MCSTEPPRPSQNIDLPQLFADALGLERRSRRSDAACSSSSDAFDQRPRRVATAEADEPFVADDLDQRVVLHVGIGAAGPAVIVGGAATGRSCVRR